MAESFPDINCNGFGEAPCATPTHASQRSLRCGLLGLSGVKRHRANLHLRDQWHREGVWRLLLLPKDYIIHVVWDSISNCWNGIVRRNMQQLPCVTRAAQRSPGKCCFQDCRERYCRCFCHRSSCTAKNMVKSGHGESVFLFNSVVFLSTHKNDRWPRR